MGLGLVVTRDGGIPLVSYVYPDNKPDATQFATMIDKLKQRHATCCRPCPLPAMNYWSTI